MRRYKPDCWYGGPFMSEHPEGEFVDYDVVKNRIAELEAENKTLHEYVDKCCKVDCDGYKALEAALREVRKEITSEVHYLSNTVQIIDDALSTGGDE